MVGSWKWSKSNVASVLKLVFRVLAFLGLAGGYLFLGYHLRDYVIDFSEMRFIQHPGVVKGDYVNSVGGLYDVFGLQSRWMTNLVVTVTMVLAVSGMVYLIFLKKKHFWIALGFYSGVVMLALFVVAVGVGVGASEMGYSFARVIKDNLIHTPFVFILLVATLRGFEV